MSRARARHPAVVARRSAVVALRAAAVAMLLAGLVASAPGCGTGGAAPGAGRGVIVLVVDALRADHVAHLGYDRATTPALDRLAHDGATFTDAWSASPEHLPAHAALLTGCDPGLARRPGAYASGPAGDLASWRVPDGLPSLAQEFLAAGFETAAFVDHPAIAPARGVAKGFQTFGAYREDAVDPDLELGFEGVATKFVHWLGGRDADADWFAYLHVNDLERAWTRASVDPRWETRYEPRPELAWLPPVAEGDHAYHAIPRTRWARVPRSLGEYEVRYDGAIGQLDAKLGRLVERLRRLGRLDQTTIVVAGSFGVSFGEDGLFLDTGGLGAADLRVPLVVRPGGSLAMRRGARIEDLASLVDVAPTLLDLHGLRSPHGMSGASHAARLRDADAPPARTVAHATGGHLRGVAAISTDGLLVRERPRSARSALLARTWWGGSPDDAPEIVERLAPRGATAGDAAATRAHLAAELDAWSAWIERARPLLHGRADPAADPATATELRRRGWLTAPR